MTKKVMEIVGVVMFFGVMTILVMPWLIKPNMLPDKNDSLHITYELNQLEINILRGKPLFWGSYYAPYANTLTFSNPLLVSAAVGFGGRIFSDSPVATYDWALFWGTVLSGLFSYLLIKKISNSSFSALIGAVVFTFSPLRLMHLPHLGVSGAWLVPLAFWLLERYLSEKKIRDFYLLSACVGLEFLDDFSMAYMLVLGVAFLFLWNRKRLNFQFSRLKVQSGIIFMTIVAVALILWPYLATLQMFGSRSIRDAANSSMGIDSLVFPYWLFWLVIGVSILVLVFCHPRPDRGSMHLDSRLRGNDGSIGVWLWMLFGSVVLMLGPVLKVGFNNTFKISGLPIPLPYGVMYYALPGFSLMRTPTRFAVLASLAAGLIVSLALGKLKSRTHIFLLRMIVCGLVLISNRLPIRGYYFDVTPPAIYQQVRELPMGSTILELPIKLWNAEGNEVESQRAIYSLYHQVRRLNGYSSYSPQEWIDMVNRINKNGLDAENIKRLKDWGVTDVVVDGKIEKIPGY